MGAGSPDIAAPQPNAWAIIYHDSVKKSTLDAHARDGAAPLLLASSGLLWYLSRSCLFARRRLAMTASENKPIGYDDTPVIPGSRYKVHDSARPQPRVVAPPTESTQDAPGRPPSDAVVLFDGTDGSGWVHADGRPMEWKVADGCMEVVPKTGDIASREHFGDCQLHVEWAAPAEVKGDSQGRGNSGVFLMGRYEIQVLDCRDNPTYADGTTAGYTGSTPRWSTHAASRASGRRSTSSGSPRGSTAGSSSARRARRSCTTGCWSTTTPSCWARRATAS